MTYLAPLLVLAFLVGILLLMVPGMRRDGYTPRTTRGLAGLIDPENARGLPRGIVGTLAAIAFLEQSPAAGLAGCLIADMLCALLARTKGIVVGAGFQALYLLGIYADVASLIQDSTCTGVSLPVRIAGILVLALCTALGALPSVFRRRQPRLGLLAPFAVLQVLTFIAGPLGVWLLGDDSWQGWAVVGAAIVFGLLASVAPVAVLALAAAATSIVTLAMGAAGGTTCGTGADVAGLTGLAGFLATYGLVHAVRSRASAQR